jgi:hypothetical protein
MQIRNDEKYTPQLFDQQQRGCYCFQQRPQLVRESNGYRLVYESEGEIYYQNSATGNGNWLGLMRLSAGNGSNKFPSIAERSGKIHVVWQRKTGTNPYDILFRHYTGSAWETIRTVTGGISSSNDLLPELHSHNQQSSVLSYAVSGNNDPTW